MRSMTSKVLTGFGVLILSLFASGIAQAQSEPDPSEPQAQTQTGTPDKPGPGMARVSMIQGDVSTQRGDSGDWSAATLNTPLAPGDKISTGDKGRAEVQLDFADVLRLADSSQASIATLERTQIQVQLGEGLAYFSMFKGHEADVEIDTPNVSIHPIGKDGAYRIYVNPGGETEVTVRNGEAEVSTPQGSTRVKKGELITVQGDASNAQFKIGEAPSKDDWDAFNQDRDRVIQNAESWRHTNRYYTGSEDLDAYGTWSEVPDVGRVWVPEQGPDWAPYRDGNWVWEPYWGWTWVGYEPWGWAPYHYGRWFVYGGSWAWWPGPVAVGYYPFWSPAYVSFFGFGPSFGVGFGWFPCGPGDFFYPWWGGFGFGFGFVDFDRFHGRGFRDRDFDRGRGFRPLLRNDRFSNLRNFEANGQLRNGFSGVSGDRFGRGGVRPTRVDPAGLKGGRIFTGNLPVVPSRESLSASGKFQRPGSGAARVGGARSFFSKNQPGARPEPFSQQASHLQNSIQKDGHFSPIVAGSRGGANAGGAAEGKFGGSTSPSSGARAVGSGKVETNNPGAGSNRGPANDRPSTGATVRGSGSAGANGGAGSTPRGGATETRPNSNTNNGGFRPFGSPSNGGATPNSGARPSAPGFSNPGGSTARPNGETNTHPSGSGNNGGWQKFSAPSNSGAGRGSSSPNGSYRPPLNMNKPIVTQRPNSGGSSTRPGGSPSYRPPSYPSSGGSRPSYSAPSYPSGGSRPSYSPPRQSAPRYSPPRQSAPSYSPPRQSAPSYSAPRQSAPSYHAPSGGGSHAPSGGGSHGGGGGGGGHSSGGGGGHPHR